MKIDRKILLGSTAFATAMALAAPGLAQSAPPADAEATTVEQIVITGSLIRRSPENAPTPLIQVDREELVSTGQTTVIDYLATIPALSNSRVPTDNTGSVLNALGLEFANLRSLGTGRTLTLVDGRRHVGSSGGSLSVDVSTIPRLLIENIEIVTGGASSIYGADAVSGVLNFIMRDDFEGMEVDANYGEINTTGQIGGRVSALIGGNFFEDRLNVYAHAEYEKQDEVTSFDMPWIARTPTVIGIDADPSSAPIDGFVDNALFYNVLRMDRPRWGQTTVANNQQPSATSNPLIPNTQCTSYFAAGCYGVNPGATWWYDNGTARPAEFGQRLGNVGVSRPFNIGGDGVSPADFGLLSQSPETESYRYQIGSSFRITPNIRAFAEAKYVEESANFTGQPTFFNIDLVNTYAADEAGIWYGNSSFDMRWSDNAFLSQDIKDAIATNTITRYSAPTADAPGQPISVVAAPYARHQMFGPARDQYNVREVTRFVAGLDGSFDNLGFVRNVNWDVSYVYGELQNANNERGVDSQRFLWAADSVVDTMGVVGTPGSIVCRIQLLDAMGVDLDDQFRGGNIQDTAYGQQSIDQCQPLNIFGAGNQSQAGLDYVAADITVFEKNEQEQFLARVGGQLWDFWGAGPMGVALGYENRREYTEAIGRDADTAGRALFLNTGPDFLGASYTSDEVFTELSVPLFRDFFLGEYAELSGSYRFADYSTVGDVETWGVNLVYRPIQDIMFRTSFNSSVRVPNLGENFAPASQTFWNAVVDPCDARVINGAALTPQERTNRIQNCSTLAANAGFPDLVFNDETDPDAYLPNYTSGIAGVNSGNASLEPEESESFTFSVVLQPRFVPNLSVVLDYYEITVDNVIASVTAATAARNCVNGASLNQQACATIFRNNPNIPFGIGGAVGDPIGGFIQGSLNYASLETRGLDFSVNYALDTFDLTGRDFGRFTYRLNGLWLIEQANYTNLDDPTDVTILGGNLYYPRVRLSSSLTYAPSDVWNVNWTMDWQTGQHIQRPDVFVNNSDGRPYDSINTGDFTRHDFTVRWNVNEDVTLRAGVVNAFNEEPNPWLGMNVYSNFDPFGRRFFMGVNYRLW